MHGTSFARNDLEDPQYDKPLVDPKHLFKVCVDRGIPTEHWFGKANSVIIPMHREPTRVNILLRKSHLDYFQNLAPLWKVHFNDGVNTVTIRNLYFVKATCVVPGGNDGDDSVYLVELADWRGRPYYDQQILEPGGALYGNAYNIHTGDVDGLFVTSTTNSGTAYTWQELLNEIVSAAGLSSMTLPFTPHGTPGPFDYRGWNPYQALFHFLDRLACGIKYDPTAETPTTALVRLGVTDVTAAAAMAAMTTTTWDEYPVPSYYQGGGTANVFFRVVPSQSLGGADNDYFYIESVSTGGSGQGVWLYDDLAALKVYVGSGVPENQTTCDARAAERATDWQRKHDGYDRPLNRVFSGIYPNAVRDVLGSTVGAIAFYDRGDGYKTQVMARPTTSLEEWRPAGKAAQGDAIYVGPGHFTTFRTSGATSEMEGWNVFNGNGWWTNANHVANGFGVSDGGGNHTLGVDGTINSSATATVRKGIITNIA